MVEKVVRKAALLNALKYGKANSGKIIGKIISEMPEIKNDLKTLMPKINKIVANVNKLSKEDVKSLIEKDFPEELDKKKEERDIFSFVPVDGKVVTAFPPDPSKYPHIGHAKAALVNFLLSKKHNGVFILRFEDTNPILPKLEFYEQFQKDLEWLGIKADKILYASDYIDIMYEKIQKLIDNGLAYVCTCSQEDVKSSREKGIACSCRDRMDSKELFTKMLKDIKEGTAIVRLKIDLTHKNTTMRDPTVFRIINHPHPRVGDKYRVWPNYDFQNAVLDGYLGITHRLRTKEFELRSELQKYIQKICHLKETWTYEFGRFNLVGVPSSGRIIREMIEKKELIGWDDPKLHTIVALRRRGFTPEGIKNFLLSTGITKNEATLTWDDLIINNKRIVDKIANRYFFIFDSKTIIVEKCPTFDIKSKKHPDSTEMSRFFHIDGRFLVQEDLNNLEDGSMIRLMDCVNIIKTNNIFEYHSKGYEEYKNFTGNKKIIHWLTDKQNLEVEVFMPDHTTIKGVAEIGIKELKVDDVIQFERFGFCRLDKIDGEKYYFWFTHR